MGNLALVCQFMNFLALHNQEMHYGLRRSGQMRR